MGLFRVTAVTRVEEELFSGEALECAVRKGMKPNESMRMIAVVVGQDSYTLNHHSVCQCCFLLAELHAFEVGSSSNGSTVVQRCE